MTRLLATVAAADDTSAADRFGDQLVAGGLWLLGCLAAAAAAVGRSAHQYCSPRYHRWLDALALPPFPYTADFTGAVLLSCEYKWVLPLLLYFCHALCTWVGNASRRT